MADKVSSAIFVASSGPDYVHIGARQVMLQVSMQKIPLVCGMMATGARRLFSAIHRSDLSSSTMI